MADVAAPTTPVQPPTPFYLTLLWFFSMVWTLILLAMNVAEFLSGGNFTYQGPGSLIYLGTLAAYAGVKEARQWSVGESVAEAKGKRGALFVAAWLALSAWAFVAINVKQGLVFPHELLTITLEVLGIFFGTHASRYLRKNRVTSAQQEGELSDRIILALKEVGGLSSSGLVERLKAPRTSVQRVVRKLLKEGSLVKVADNPNDPETRYKVG